MSKLNDTDVCLMLAKRFHETESIQSFLFDFDYLHFHNNVYNVDYAGLYGTGYLLSPAPSPPNFYYYE